MLLGSLEEGLGKLTRAVCSLQRENCLGGVWTSVRTTLGAVALETCRWRWQWLFCATYLSAHEVDKLLV